ALAEEILAEAIERTVVADAAIAESLAQFHEFWGLRESMSEAQKPEGASIKHDISVPVAAIPRFIEEGARLVQQISPGARLVCFGKMVDGNLNFNETQPEGGDPKAFLARYRAMNDAVHALVNDLGGSFSAEHGIGRQKREELIATAPPVAIELMRTIK